MSSPTGREYFAQSILQLLGVPAGFTLQDILGRPGRLHAARRRHMQLRKDRMRRRAESPIRAAAESFPEGT